jgi:hypothetical protein
MTPMGRRTGWSGVAALAVAATAAIAGQAPGPFPGTLDEHPVVRYAERPPADRVARLNEQLAAGRATLQPDDRTGYLVPVLRALDIPIESQLLVFSKTGLQREFTGPTNPRALYFNGSVVVGYIPGAPSLEIAAHDPQQGVMFYTLDQGPSTSPPAFVRRTNCLACHVSVSTQEVPGFIDRSNLVTGDGQVMPQLGSFAVSHRTPHTERWGGWFVTGKAAAPPYGPLGHLGNITVSSHPTSGPAIFSDQVLIEWLNRPRESDKYLGSESDLAALMTFDHQMHGLNLITRLNWEARIAAAEGRPWTSEPAIVARVRELAEYLLFVDEAPLGFEVTPRPGFAEALAVRAPADRQGRSCAQMDLTRRLLKYSCSYLLYSEAFAALPADLRAAVFRSLFARLEKNAATPAFDHLTPQDRRAIAEILRGTVEELRVASLLHPQPIDGIHVHGPQRGRQAGDDGGGHQDRGRHQDRTAVGRRHFVEHAR